jgi:D-alanyl-D-alanine carboxypeptidase (penicillin-binding protein 5/6)
MRAFLLRLLALLCLAAPVQAFETTATSAWVYDVNTSTVLMSKNAEAPIPPAMTPAWSWRKGWQEPRKPLPAR